MIKYCEYCGKQFETNRETKRFCSRRCKEKSKQKRIKQGIRLDNINYSRTCPICNTEFTTVYKDKIYCSDSCRNKAIYQKNKGKYTKVKIYKYTYNLICKTCGKSFKASNRTVQYCSECKENGRFVRICKKCGETFIGTNYICNKCKIKEKTSKNVKYTKECIICGKLFETTSKYAKYCSRACEKVSDNKRAKLYRDDPESNYKQTQRKWRKKWSKTPEGKLRAYMGATLRRCVSSNHNLSVSTAFGYTYKELRGYLQGLFTKDMTWDNYGSVWQIDHIKPLASFNFFNQDGSINKSIIREANNLNNLQPLYIKDNLQKSSWHNGVFYKKGEPLFVKDSDKKTEGV